MLSQARVAHARAARPLILSQRRFLATPPPPPGRPAVVINTPNNATVVTPLPAGSTPTAPSGTPIPPSASGTLPLPPPREPKRPRRFFRRFFIYTALGVLTFYPLSGWLSTQYEGYRDFFVDTFPGAEFVADYADDHNWETFGAGSVSKKAVQGWQKVTGDESRPGSIKDAAAERLRDFQRNAETTGKKAEAEGKSVLKALEDKAKEAAETVRTKAGELTHAAEKKAASLREDARDVKAAARPNGYTLRDESSEAAVRETNAARRDSVSLRDDGRPYELGSKDTSAGKETAVDKLGRAVRKETASLREDAHDVADKARKEGLSLREDAGRVVDKVTNVVKKETASLREEAHDVADKATKAARRESVSLREGAHDATEKVKSETVSLRDGAENMVDRFKSAAKTESVSLRETATDATERVKALASDAKAKVVGAAAGVGSKASEASQKVSDSANGLVREAERALGKGQAKVEDAVDRTENALKRGESKVESAAERAKQKLEENPGPHGYLDSQRPRELRPETVSPKKPTYEGQTLYSGPALPVGHEPPPGFYVPPPPSSRVKDGADKTKETLPLLAPKVKEFAASEPIVSQLASTIDSLASSLATPNSGEPNKILTKAQDDLTALSKRLADVKKLEKERLEKTVGEKTKEFEQLLKTKEQERAQGEQGLRQGWEKEKASMVDNWRGNLEKELESQRQGIEQRLREEVVSQGIELQRRWLRSIKSQVETERGGRLAKLDHLTTSLKQLERITLDNSATLDDNVRVHKVWSALRAVQAKAESGDVSFEDELRLLKSLSPENSSVVAVALAQLDQSGIAQTGVKSFASLASWFSNGVSPRVHSASLVPKPEEASVLSHVASATFSKVMFTPKAGLVDGDDVSSTLARAEWCLGEKDLDGAAREVNSLKGWPAKLAADWLREARRRLEVQQALEIVGAEATLGSLLLV